MLTNAFGPSTVGNYGPKFASFAEFCVEIDRPCLPASEETVLLYIGRLLQRGTVAASSMQPYLSAINTYHEDLGHPGPAKGRSITRAVKGMTAIQTLACEASGVVKTQRQYLPAEDIAKVQDWAVQQFRKLSSRKRPNLELCERLRAAVFWYSGLCISFEAILVSICFLVTFLYLEVK